MMRTGSIVPMVAALTATAATAMLAQFRQAPVFRSTVSTVTVNVSVKRGNNAVTKLTAADFRLTDNGVPQKIDALEIENVPVDVTLFLDTSGSTSSKLDEMAEDVQAIAKMLVAGDRFRLLTIGDSVYPAIPWTAAGTPFNARFDAVGGISVIHDALIAALVHQPSPGRRHLIVGMTDRQDCGSAIPSTLLLELAGRTDAVMHLVDYSGGGGQANYRVRSCSPRARSGGPAIIQQAAERTGGTLREQSFLFRGTSIARAFRAILDDFRQSYVLRYTATGVDGPGLARDRGQRAGCPWCDGEGQAGVLRKIGFVDWLNGGLATAPAPESPVRPRVRRGAARVRPARARVRRGDRMQPSPEACRSDRARGARDRSRSRHPPIA
jgi:VWFA-related protein